MGSEKERIEAIILYCDKIDEMLNEFGKDEDIFVDKPIFQYASSFCISQIGECVKSLSPGLTKKYPEVNWKGISGMRDVIVHGYSKIDLGRIWILISEEIPALKTACERILREMRS